jgi:hypothetical protein
VVAGPERLRKLAQTIVHDHGTWQSRTTSSRRRKDSEYGTEDRDSPPDS